MYGAMWYLRASPGSYAGFVSHDHPPIDSHCDHCDLSGRQIYPHSYCGATRGEARSQGVTLGDYLQQLLLRACLL